MAKLAAVAALTVIHAYGFYRAWLPFDLLQRGKVPARQDREMRAAVSGRQSAQLPGARRVHEAIRI